MKFSTVLTQTGTNTTGIEIPPEIVEALGAGKKPKVLVDLNGYQYRSSIATLSGTFLIPVSAEIRGKANVKGGDPIEVEVAVDDAPREVVIPADFAQALEDSKAAKTNFNALSYSNRNRHVLAIESAKTDDTRQKRIAKAINELQR